MTIRTRTALGAALALSALVVLLVAQTAQATHPRPKGATPLRTSLVVGYNACTVPNRTHGPSLVFPSCNPPVQTSTSVTVGSPDANAAPANMVGSVRFDVCNAAGPTCTGVATFPDVKMVANVTDVRCKAGTTTCGSVNAADGPDYTGELEGVTSIRVTDHYNGVLLNEAATAIDLPLTVTIPCVATASTAEGGGCPLATTVNSLVPGAIGATRRTVVQAGQSIVNDGGTDGTVATAFDNTPFLVQGLFVP
jgi:hypothetical protein